MDGFFSQQEMRLLVEEQIGREVRSDHVKDAIQRRFLVPKVRVGQQWAYDDENVTQLLQFMLSRRETCPRVGHGWKVPTYRDMRKREPLDCEYLYHDEWYPGKLMAIMAGNDSFFVDTGHGRKWFKLARVPAKLVYGPSVLGQCHKEAE